MSAGPTTRRVVLLIGLLLAGAAPAAPVTYTDTAGDQVGSGNKARDLRSATIDNDLSNLTITINLDPGADLSPTNNFNYGIGITKGAGAGGDLSTNATTHGNAYQRTLSIDNSLGGMTNWIGVFGANSAGGAYGSVGYNAYTWNSPTAGVWTKIHQVASGQTLTSQAATSTHNTFTIVVPLTDLPNFAIGDTIYFDIYSTGTSAGQTAYDSLADLAATNGTNSATTQYNGTVLYSYTLTPEPAGLTVIGLAVVVVLRRTRRSGRPLTPARLRGHLLETI